MNLTGAMETMVYKNQANVQSRNHIQNSKSFWFFKFTLTKPFPAKYSPDLEEMGAQFPVPSLEPEGVEQSAGLPEVRGWSQCHPN